MCWWERETTEVNVRTSQDGRKLHGVLVLCSNYLFLKAFSPISLAAFFTFKKCTETSVCVLTLTDHYTQHKTETASSSSLLIQQYSHELKHAYKSAFLPSLISY